MDLWLITICGIAVGTSVVALLVVRALRLDRRLLAGLGHYTVDSGELIDELARCAQTARSTGLGSLHMRTPGVRHPLLSRGSHLLAIMAEPQTIRAELNTLVDHLLRSHARRSAVARWISVCAPIAALGALTVTAACWLGTLDDPTSVAGGFAIAALGLFACGVLLQTVGGVTSASIPSAPALTLSSVIVIEGLVAIREGLDKDGVIDRVVRFIPDHERPAPLRRAA